MKQGVILWDCLSTYKLIHVWRLFCTLINKTWVDSCLVLLMLWTTKKLKASS